MDAPAETEFGKLLLVGIGLMLLAGVLLVLFVVAYQKRLLLQQLRLRAAEAEHQQQLLAAVVQAQELERERIGRDLHDGIGATLATAKLLVSRLAAGPAASAPHPADTAALPGMVQELLGTAVHDVRGLSHSLFPAVLTRYGLAEALQHLVDVSNEAGGPVVELDLDYETPLELAHELALYRICQELLHNAFKHARGATRLEVQLQQQGSHLVLAVADDGCGFDASAPGSRGAGLRSIDVRVQLLRARLHQESAPGRGSRTSIEMTAAA